MVLFWIDSQNGTADAKRSMHVAAMKEQKLRLIYSSCRCRKLFTISSLAKEMSCIIKNEYIGVLKTQPIPRPSAMDGRHKKS